jgi:hypothetical protein
VSKALGCFGVEQRVLELNMELRAEGCQPVAQLLLLLLPVAQLSSWWEMLSS